MKILLIQNKPEREQAITGRIAHWAQRLMPSCRTKIVDFADPEFLVEAIAFCPDVVVSFPLTSVGASYAVTLLKFCCDSTVVTLETEGGTGFETDRPYIKQFVGYDTYSPQLVDYALYWGSHGARHIGGLFFEEGKIAAPERNLVFGYPLYELYFSAEDQAEQLSRLPAEIGSAMAGFPEQRRVLVVTGFHTGDYTEENCIAAGDLFDTRQADYSRELATVLRRVELDRKRRADWIEAILAMAGEREDTLFMVKYHPLEANMCLNRGIDPYHTLRNRKNILLVTDARVSVFQLLHGAAALVHYGSTAVVETYLLGKQSVYVYDPELHGEYENLYHDRCDPKGWPSTHATTIKGLKKALCGILDGPGAAEVRTELTARVLDEFFNIRDGEAYLPSRGIAAFLLRSRGAAQPFLPDDPHLAVHFANWLPQVLSGLGSHLFSAVLDGDAERVGRFTDKVRKILTLRVEEGVRRAVFQFVDVLARRLAQHGEQAAKSGQGRLALSCISLAKRIAPLRSV